MQKGAGVNTMLGLLTSTTAAAVLTGWAMIHTNATKLEAVEGLPERVARIEATTSQHSDAIGDMAKELKDVSAGVSRIDERTLETRDATKRLLDLVLEGKLGVVTAEAPPVAKGPETPKKQGQKS